MCSKKLYFWQALLMIYVIPVIAFTILVSCIDSPRFTSIMNQLASTTNYLSVISNLIDFGVIIFAFMHYYRLPLALGGGGVLLSLREDSLYYCVWWESLIF